MNSGTGRADQRDDTPRRRRIRAVVIVAAAVVALAGCGGDDGTDTASDSMTADAEATSAGTPDMTPSEPSTPPTDDMSSTETPADPPTEPPTEPPAMDAAAPGIYRDYSPEAVAEAGYERTILFFHASWCPECRAFEESLTSTELPAGLQILKVDYDTADDLKSQHEVTIQTTFVEVDDDGEHLASWVGYEKDRSIDTVLDGLG